MYCSFLDHGILCKNGEKLVYRHYATLFFVFVVTPSESELAILDLIQVLVEVLDRVFENVCELDLIFHMDKVQLILSEMIQGGMVLETSLVTIVNRIKEDEIMTQSDNGVRSAINSAQNAISSISDRLPKLSFNR